MMLWFHENIKHLILNLFKQRLQDQGKTLHLGLDKDLNPEWILLCNHFVYCLNEWEKNAIWLWVQLMSISISQVSWRAEKNQLVAPLLSWSLEKLLSRGKSYRSYGAGHHHGYLNQNRLKFTSFWSMSLDFCFERHVPMTVLLGNLHCFCLHSPCLNAKSPECCGLSQGDLAFPLSHKISEFDH